MKRVGLMVFVCLFLFGCIGQRQTESVLILVGDGMGAKYMGFFEGAPPLAMDGSELEKAKTPVLESLKGKALYSVFRTRFPETIASHSVFYIAGDCGKQFAKVKNCVDNAGMVSICDVARANNHLCIMVSESGDFKEARSEFDVAFFDAGKWDFRVERNSNSREAIAVEEFLKSKAVSGFDGNKNSLEEYSAFILNIDSALLEFLHKVFPEKKFVVFSNAKGVDLCGHRGNPKRYSECISEFDHDINSLIVAAEKTGTLLAITADHGMAFECTECRGSHASYPFNETAEAREIPFIVFGSKQFGRIESADSSMLVPIVFSLAGFQDSCKRMRYCSLDSTTKGLNGLEAS